GKGGRADVSWELPFEGMGLNSSGPAAAHAERSTGSLACWTPTCLSESRGPRQKPIPEISSPCVRPGTQRAIIAPRACSSGFAEAGAAGREDRAMACADQTTVIQGCLDRLRGGDDSARAALLRCAAGRLARLAGKMLRGYPGVARWEQGDDVAQNALIRL